MMIFLFVSGILIGYIIRLLVEDTDKKYESMKEYQSVISSLKADCIEEKNG